MSSTPEPHRRVLGIDPGTLAVGWGIVERRGNKLRAVGHGTLRANRKLPVDRRLAAIAAGLREVLAQHAPTEAAMEETFYGRDPRAAQRIGEGRGALLLVLAEAGLPVSGYANNVVKKAVTGVGRASKAQVQAMVARVLGLREEPGSSDAADALALAVCHHQRPELPAGGGVPPRLAAALKAAEERRAGGARRRTGRDR